MHLLAIVRIAMSMYVFIKKGTYNFSLCDYSYCLDSVAVSNE